MYAKTPRREGREGVKHQELMMGGWRGVGEVKAGEADGSWTTQDLVGRIQEPGLPWGHHPTGSSSREGGHISPQSHFYLLCFGFNFSMGESFQKDPWVDP